MQVTYQKRDGSIIQRLRNTAVPYKIGEETSMGWKVLDIEYEYKNNFYPEYKYHTLVHKNKLKELKKKKIIEKCMNDLRTLVYCCIVIVVLNLLKLMLGI